MSLDPLVWLLGPLLLLNLGWVAFVNWVWKKLPDSDRVRAYCIFLSGPLGWALFIIMVAVRLPSEFRKSEAQGHESSRAAEEVNQALKDAQERGLLFGESPDGREDKFDDPDFDWESHEFFESLKENQHE